MVSPAPPRPSPLRHGRPSPAPPRSTPPRPRSGAAVPGLVPLRHCRPRPSPAPPRLAPLRRGWPRSTAAVLAPLRRRAVEERREKEEGEGRRSRREKEEGEGRRKEKGGGASVAGIANVLMRMVIRPSTEYINSVKSLVQAAKADVKVGPGAGPDWAGPTAPLLTRLPPAPVLPRHRRRPRRRPPPVRSYRAHPDAPVPRPPPPSRRRSPRRPPGAPAQPRRPRAPAPAAPLPCPSGPTPAPRRPRARAPTDLRPCPGGPTLAPRVPGRRPELTGAPGSELPGDSDPAGPELHRPRRALRPASRGRRRGARGRKRRGRRKRKKEKGEEEEEEGADPTAHRSSRRSDHPLNLALLRSSLPSSPTLALAVLAAKEDLWEGLDNPDRLRRRCGSSCTASTHHYTDSPPPCYPILTGTLE
ncbi:extensin-like [Miscanthus floridulus]|uniref:extensin-like n=1 Tax=Miscanthus floridulus TaxID=154761 RepID=UPI0034596188